MEDSNKASVWSGIILIAFIFGIIALITSIRLVGTGQIGVVTNFGRVTGRELNEGIHLVKPFGINRVTKYDVKVQKQEAHASAASKDLQDVNSTLVVNYQVEKGKVSEIHKTIGKDFTDKLINPAIQEVFKASTAKYDATQLITNRAGVKRDAYELLKNRLNTYGIVVTDISITNFSFSEDFSKAIESKQVAQQQAEQAKFNAQKAEQDAQAEINRAKGAAEAQRLQQRTLTPLIVQKLFLEKWDGKLPTVTGGQNIMDISSLINTKKK